LKKKKEKIGNQNETGNKGLRKSKEKTTPTSIFGRGGKKELNSFVHADA